MTRTSLHRLLVGPWTHHVLPGNHVAALCIASSKDVSILHEKRKTELLTHASTAVLAPLGYLWVYVTGAEDLNENEEVCTRPLSEREL